MVFKITARTVLELGSELISSDIIAFYELIKNGFDAGTKDGVDIRFNIVIRRNDYLGLRRKALANTKSTSEVASLVQAALNADASIELLDQSKDLLQQAATDQELVDALDQIYEMSHIVVSDTGSGMSVDDLNNNFLVIGTASRKREVDKALRTGESKSPFLGEKGIGRLSAMRLGDTLRVETAKATDSHLNCLDIDWSDFAQIDAMLADIDIRPTQGDVVESRGWSGTRIIIGKLTEDWTAERVKRMAEYDFSRLTDPFIDPKKRPRVALYWNEDRVSIPWMQKALVQGAHVSVDGAYTIVDGKPQLSCEVKIKNLGFPHPVESDDYLISAEDLESAVIGTSREIPESALASLGPFTFQVHWYNRRLLTSMDGIGDLRAVREQQQRWSGILLYRDGFRVFPYGEDEDDWLALDRKALARTGYTLNKAQFVGKVEISRVENASLVDQTNREGLRETPEQQVFLGVMQYVIQDLLFKSMKNVEKQYKAQKVDLSEAKTEVANLDARAKDALAKLRRVAPKDDPSLEELQQTLFDFSEFAERARQRIEEVEQESRQMIEMAGVGLMVEVVAHELARASENALENLEALRGKNIPEEVKAKLDSLRAQMKSLGKRIRVLDPLSVSGRQRVETFDLRDLILNTLEAHQAQFERHKISVKLSMSEDAVAVRTIKGMVVQILENLISNSKYWLDMGAGKQAGKKSTISITLLPSPPLSSSRTTAPASPKKIRSVSFDRSSL
jgi:signal transduction histidine kinase